MHRALRVFLPLILALFLCLGLQSVSLAEGEEDAAPPTETLEPTPELTEPTPEPEPSYTEISRMTMTINPNVPIVLDSISAVTASATSSNITVTSMEWYDKNGNIASGSFEKQSYTLKIYVSANDGYCFSSSVQGYINNVASIVALNADRRKAVVSRLIEPTAYAPTVCKDPYGEHVTAGEYASFNSTALYYSSIEWILLSPDEKESFAVSKVGDRFKGVTYTLYNDGTTMTLHNIPAEMDGWMVRCGFTGAGTTVYSARAKLSVDAPKATPSPSPSAEPTPSPSPSPSAEPSPSPSPSPSAEPSPSPSAEPSAPAETSPEPEDVIQTEEGDREPVESKPVSGGLFGGIKQKFAENPRLPLLICLGIGFAVLTATAIGTAANRRK